MVSFGDQRTTAGESRALGSRASGLLQASLPRTRPGHPSSREEVAPDPEYCIEAGNASIGDKLSSKGLFVQALNPADDSHVSSLED